MTSFLDAETRIVIRVKGGDSIYIDSPDTVSSIADQTVETKGDFIAFKDISGSIVVVKTNEIVALMLYPKGWQDVRTPR